jgi:hypothetical protein
MAARVYGPLYCSRWDVSASGGRRLVLSRNHAATELALAAEGGRVDWVVVGGGVSEVAAVRTHSADGRMPIELSLSMRVPEPAPPLPGLRRGVVLPSAPFTLYVLGGGGDGGA